VDVVAIVAVATNTANRRRIDEPKGQVLFPSALVFCSMTGALTYRFDRGADRTAHAGQEGVRREIMLNCFLNRYSASVEAQP
jgi:hypothetical protein